MPPLLKELEGVELLELFFPPSQRVFPFPLFFLTYFLNLFLTFLSFPQYGRYYHRLPLHFRQVPISPCGFHYFFGVRDRTHRLILQKKVQAHRRGNLLLHLWLTVNREINLPPHCQSTMAVGG